MICKKTIEIHQYLKVQVDHSSKLTPKKDTMQFSFWRLANALARSGISAHLIDPPETINVLNEAIWLLRNTILREKVALRAGIKTKLRDHHKSYHSGRLAEAMTWIFAEEKLEARGLCDFSEYLKSIRVPLKSNKRTDFCFFKGNEFHIIESKGSWPSKQNQGIKAALKKGLAQNSSSRSLIKGIHSVAKDHVTGVWLAEESEGWDSVIHYIDPEHGNSNPPDKALLMNRLYYATWFSMVGAFEASRRLYFNQPLEKVDLTRGFSSEELGGRNYYFVSVSDMGSLFYPYHSCVDIKRFPVKFGIASVVVDGLVENRNFSLEGGSTYKEKFETYRDGTAVKWE